VQTREYEVSRPTPRNGLARAESRDSTWRGCIVGNNYNLLQGVALSTFNKLAEQLDGAMPKVTHRDLTRNLWCLPIRISSIESLCNVKAER
jgi:hypothetical protein